MRTATEAGTSGYIWTQTVTINAGSLNGGGFDVDSVVAVGVLSGVPTAFISASPSTADI